MLPIPKTKNNELFNEIYSQFRKNEKFNEIKFHTLKREIEKLPSFTEQNNLLGLIYCVQKNQNKMLECFNKAISTSNTQYTIYLNFAVSLEHFGLYTKCDEILNEAINKYPNTLDVLEMVTSRHIIKLDLKNANYYLDQIFKLYKDHKPSKMINFLNLFNQFKEIDKITESLAKIGKIIFEKLNKHKIKSQGIFINIYDYEEKELAITYSLKNISPQELLNLNMELINKLISNDLDTIPVTVQFSLEEN